MLKQKNSEVTKVKRRKLYTPLSDEENIPNEPAVGQIFENVKIALKTQQYSAVKENMQHNKDVVTKVIPSPQEVAENEFWKKIKPIFETEIKLIGDSIWQYCFRFNPVEIANKMTLIRTTRDINEESINIAKITEKISTNNDKIKAKFVAEQQQNICHSPKNQVYCVTETLQAHHSNDFSNNSHQIINCDALTNIFEQHAVDDKKNHTETISSINNGHFISSQFIDTVHVDESSCNAGKNESKKLLNSCQILYELLDNHTEKSNDLADDQRIQKSSLSESKKKLQSHNSFRNCFL